MNQLLPFSKRKLLMTILSILEKETCNDFAKKATFDNVLQHVKTAHGINYQEEKVSVKEAEDLAKVFETKAAKTFEMGVNAQVPIGGFFEFRENEQLEIKQYQSIKTAISDIKKLISVQNVAPEEQIQAKDLLQIFIDSQVETYKANGFEHLSKGEYVEATEAFTIAMAYNKDDAALFSGRATAQVSLKNHHQCLKDCLDALRLNPFMDSGYARLGFSLSVTQMWDLGYTIYKSAAAARWDYVIILIMGPGYWLARWICTEMGFYVEAVDAYQEAVNLDPNNEYYQKCLKSAKKRSKECDDEQCVIS